MSAQRKKFPIEDEKEWTAARAIEELETIEKWARQMGFVNIAPRLAWAIKMLKSTNELPSEDKP